MKRQATGWLAVRYGDAIFSVYNYVPIGDERRVLSTSHPDGQLSEAEVTAEMQPSSSTPSEAIAAISLRP
jgi:hypothetical protein